MLLLTRVTIPNFVILGHAYNWRSVRKNDPSRPHSRSLDVIEADTDRSAFTSIITMGLSRTVSAINGDFGQKSQIFPIPVYLTPPLKEFPLEFYNGSSAKKLGSFSCQMVERVCLSVHSGIAPKRMHSHIVKRISENNIALYMHSMLTRDENLLQFDKIRSISKNCDEVGK